MDWLKRRSPRSEEVPAERLPAQEIRDAVLAALGTLWPTRIRMIGGGSTAEDNYDGRYHQQGDIPPNDFCLETWSRHPGCDEVELLVRTVASLGVDLGDVPHIIDSILGALPNRTWSEMTGSGAVQGGSEFTGVQWSSWVSYEGPDLGALTSQHVAMATKQ
jgi:hypothetical protein